MSADREIVLSTNIMSTNKTIGQTPGLSTNRPDSTIELSPWITRRILQGYIVSGNVTTVADISARDALTRATEGDIVVVQDSDGFGTQAVYVYDQNESWVVLGGGSTGGSTNKYSINNNANVTASGLGVSSTLNTGVMTVSVPNNVHLLRISKTGTSSDLNINNEFVLNVNYAWTSGLNTDEDDLVYPTINIWDVSAADFGAISPANPIVLHTSVPPNVRITDISTDSIQFTFTDLDLISKWSIVCNF